MSSKLLPTTLAAALLSSAAYADVPSVAVDIAPVHSLVALVMDGVGTPDLIVQPGASPHEYSLRPSDAAALEKADLVVWMGEDLTPWMDDAVETLAKNAKVTSLLEVDETKLLDFREGALFEAHEHGEDEHHDDEHDHDDHADHDDHDEHAEDKDRDHDHEEHAEDKDHDHDHEEHAEAKDHDHEDHAHDDHDDHDEDHAGHEGHNHGEHDPHAWLSIENAGAWLNVIAAQLSAVDPDSAGAYFANASAAIEELGTLQNEVSEILAPARGRSFIVFHDAYQYFEADFDFPAAGAISLSDASGPSPARIAEIQARVQNEGVDCVLAEPQYDPGLVATVTDGSEAKTGVLDPLGSDVEPGPAMYPQMMRNLANVLAGCLQPMG